MTMTLTMDWVKQSHTIVQHSSTSTYKPNSFKSEKLFVDGRTDIEAGFIRSIQRS